MERKVRSKQVDTEKVIDAVLMRTPLIPHKGATYNKGSDHHVPTLDSLPAQRAMKPQLFIDT